MTQRAGSLPQLAARVWQLLDAESRECAYPVLLAIAAGGFTVAGIAPFLAMLDPSAELEIVSLLRALRGRCTVVLIAHRATSLQGCDELFEPDGVWVVGRGATA
jgi:hypothetical protein